MPWNPQGGGGGPWGSGGGGGGPSPWGRGPGGGGPKPPDIEELLRRSQDRFKRAVPGGFGGGKGVALIVLAALVLWGATGFYRVQTDEQGVVLRFGEYVRTAGEGLHYHLPSPIETVLIPKVTPLRTVELGFRAVSESRGRAVSPRREVVEESLMLTGDENIVDINFTVFWNVKDAQSFLFNLRDPEGTVKVAAESAMRETVGQLPIQTVLTEGRTEIELRTEKLLQGLLDNYQTGIHIDKVQLQKVDPPAPVIDAFNDVQRAKADQERLRNEAEAYRNDIIPRARGEAERLLQEAEAYKEQVVNLAQGEAGRFESVLGAYSIAKDVTARRLYLEAMQDILKGSNKVIIDPAAQGGQGVVPYLPLPELRNQRPAANANANQTQNQAQGGGR